MTEMYKPVPFFMSSRGYGMFVHSTVPMTFDMGATNDGANALYIGDDPIPVNYEDRAILAMIVTDLQDTRRRVVELEGAL